MTVYSGNQKVIKTQQLVIFLENFGYEGAPLILAFVLGHMFELNLRHHSSFHTEVF